MHRALFVLLYAALPSPAQEPVADKPLPPAEAATRFDVAEDLHLDQVLAEPHVRQPLSVKFDERGRLWVVEYIQYPYPAGLKMVSRDSYWRAVYDKRPVAPPHHMPGLDRISIHEDSNGDGRFDTHSTFLEGTSITTAMEFGDDGIWVLNPPYLLFYPDINQDDIPDGDPIVHLEGFGIEDTHSCANSLCWGPDGWLYGAQGSTVSGRIQRRGIDSPAVTSMGQLIWRYHPVLRQYEIFAEGGGNAFGVEFDSRGRVYSGHNGGNTRGFHYVQGGYYQKGFSKHGPLSNPFAFGYFSWMQHDNVPRFTHDILIYEGGSLPPAYDGRLFGVGPLQNHLVMSQVQPAGSTFRTRDVGHPVQGSDTRFRPVEITLGPDGGIYISDFYEQQISHRQHFEGQIEKDTGRIYRLQARDARPLQPFDLRTRSTGQLIDLLEHSNRWFRQTALRLLGARRDRSGLPRLLQNIRENDGQLALESLWAVNRIGGFSEQLAVEWLQHGNPWVRVWTVRLLGDQRQVGDATAQALRNLAEREPHAEVRSQLACSARRLPAESAIPLVRQLAGHDEDVSDPHLPLLIWWAIEARTETDSAAVVRLFADPEFQHRPIVREHLLSRVVRRYARSGHRRDLLAVAALLDSAADDDAAKPMLAGFEQAFEGRSMSGLPDPLVDALARRGGGSEVLRVRQRKPAALTAALQVLSDKSAPVARRIRLAEALRDLAYEPAVPALLQVVTGDDDPRLQTTCVAALQTFDSADIGRSLLQAWRQLSEDVRSAAVSLLASRPVWARQLVSAVERGDVNADVVEQEIVWRLQQMKDPQLVEAARRVWGAGRAETSAELREKVRQILNAVVEDQGDPYAGKEIFTSTCAKCHRLFDSGGEIGPDLTPYKRDDLARVLLNIVDPNTEIREGFETWLAVTEDGRTVSGFKVDEDDQVVVLRGSDGVNVTVPRNQIEELAKQPVSLMPTGLLDKMNDQQRRDLFAYLRSSQPLNNAPGR